MFDPTETTTLGPSGARQRGVGLNWRMALTEVFSIQVVAQPRLGED